ncbi:DUF1534 domain-containing protein [Pseudomonas amygdali pv. tabaci str. ATCC 11528]|nr:DUF1534 domain-containing protein [Pseudomonas amygdali pv. tabaci str. ATCC 11528]
MLRRWHAVRDALRHKFAPRRLLGTGCRASGALERSFKNVQHRDALVIEGLLE